MDPNQENNQPNIQPDSPFTGQPSQESSQPQSVSSTDPMHQPVTPVSPVGPTPQPITPANPAPQPGLPNTAPLNSVAASPDKIKSNKNMAIAGLILSFFIGLVGLIIGIVSMKNAKKLGVKNNIALASLIVGGVVTVGQVLASLFIGLLVYSAVSQCANGGGTTTSADGAVVASCTIGDGSEDDADSPQNPSQSDDEALDGDSASKPKKEIFNTPVEVVDGVVESECWSFDLPSGYILNSGAGSCVASLRIAQTSGYGDSVGTVSITPQTGRASLDSANELFDGQEADGAKISSRTTTTFAGKQALKVVGKGGFGLDQVIYFVIDNDSGLTTQGQGVTSYMVTGNTHNPKIAAATQTVIDSFKFK